MKSSGSAKQSLGHKGNNRGGGNEGEVLCIIMAFRGVRGDLVGDSQRWQLATCLFGIGVRIGVLAGTPYTCWLRPTMYCTKFKRHLLQLIFSLLTFADEVSQVKTS